jgi:hypothetical protein
MGVDISGRKPKTEAGDYFCSNWWGWRPIVNLCEIAIDNYKLKLNTDYWGSNDGKGLRTQKQCDKLADALEDLLGTQIHAKEDDDRIFLCLGSWVEAGTGRFIGGEAENKINEEIPYGSIHYTPIVSENGMLVESAHSASVFKIKQFIVFLRNCGGFRIW